MFKKIILLILAIFLTGCSLTKEKYSYVYSFGHHEENINEYAFINNGVIILTPDKQVLQGGYIKFNHDELKKRYDDNFEVTRIEITYSTSTQKVNADNTIAKFEIKANKGSTIDLNQTYVLDKKEENVLNGHTINEIIDGINVDIMYYNNKGVYSPNIPFMELTQIAQIENK